MTHDPPMQGCLRKAGQRLRRSRAPPPRRRYRRLRHAARLCLCRGASSATALGVGTEGALRAALPEVQIDADNLDGRPSAAGVLMVAEMLGPEHDTVVFDLGTNDGNAAVADHRRQPRRPCAS